MMETSTCSVSVSSSDTSINGERRSVRKNRYNLSYEENAMNLVEYDNENADREMVSHNNFDLKQNTSDTDIINSTDVNKKKSKKNVNKNSFSLSSVLPSSAIQKRRKYIKKIKTMKSSTSSLQSQLTKSSLSKSIPSSKKLKIHSTTGEQSCSNSKAATKVHSCEYCNGSFPSNYRLKQHEVLCKKTINHNLLRVVVKDVCKECPVCKRVGFPNINALKKHLTLTHPSLLYYSCKLCCKPTGDTNQTYKHILTTHSSPGMDSLPTGEGQSKRACPVCCKVFSNPSRMKLHVPVCYSNNLTVTCSLCQRVVGTAMDYLTHFQTYHVSSEHSKWNKKDVKATPSKYNAANSNNHQLTLASDSDPTEMICPYCDKHFDFNSNDENEKRFSLHVLSHKIKENLNTVLDIVDKTESKPKAKDKDNDTLNSNNNISTGCSSLRSLIDIQSTHSSKPLTEFPLSLTWSQQTKFYLPRTNSLHALGEDIMASVNHALLSMSEMTKQLETELEWNDKFYSSVTNKKELMIKLQKLTLLSSGVTDIGKCLLLVLEESQPLNDEKSNGNRSKHGAVSHSDEYENHEDNYHYHQAETMNDDSNSINDDINDDDNDNNDDDINDDDDVQIISQTQTQRPNSLLHSHSKNNNAGGDNYYYDYNKKIHYKNKKAATNTRPLNDDAIDFKQTKQRHSDYYSTINNNNDNYGNNDDADDLIDDVNVSFGQSDTYTREEEVVIRSQFKTNSTNIDDDNANEIDNGILQHLKKHSLPPAVNREDNINNDSGSMKEEIENNDLVAGFSDNNCSLVPIRTEEFLMDELTVDDVNIVSKGDSNTTNTKSTRTSSSLWQQVKTEIPDSSSAGDEPLGLLGTKLDLRPKTEADDNHTDTKSRSSSSGESLKKAKEKKEKDVNKRVDIGMNQVKEKDQFDAKTGRYRKTFQCPVCLQSFKKKGYLAVHLDIHTNVKPYKCNQCDYATNQSCNLNKHIKRHASKGRYKCDISDCDFHAKSLNLIEGHMTEHPDCPLLPCDICPHSFKTSHSLAFHKQAHDKKKCKHCDFKAKGLTELRSHLKNEHPEFKCPKCDYVATATTYLERHMKAHLKDGTFVCDLCGNVYNNREALNYHLKRHDDKTPLSCNLCDFKCRSKNALQLHVRKHTGFKPFKCELCDKSFYTTGFLKKHMFQHTKEKPYKCQYCNKAFSYDYSHSEHEKLHLGLRKLKCQFCPYVCRQEKSMDEHNQTRHNVFSSSMDQLMNQSGAVLSFVP